MIEVLFHNAGSLGGLGCRNQQGVLVGACELLRLSDGYSSDPLGHLAKWRHREAWLPGSASLRPLSTEIVVTMRGELFFRHEQPTRRLKVGGALTAAKGLKVGVAFDPDLRKIVLVDGAALGA